MKTWSDLTVEEAWSEVKKYLDRCVAELADWVKLRYVFTALPLPKNMWEYLDYAWEGDTRIFFELGDRKQAEHGFHAHHALADMMWDAFGAWGCTEVWGQSQQQNKTMIVGAAAGRALRLHNCWPHNRERRPMTDRQCLVKWLQELPAISHVVAGTARVAGQEFVAARYKRAVREGQGKEPDEFIYILGERPKAIQRRACFVRHDSPYEWFIATWYEGDVAEYHPYGAHFIVTPWTHTDKIDASETVPYERKQFDFEEGDPEQE